MELYNWPRMSVSSGGSGNLTLVAISGYPTIADVVGIGVQFTFAISTNVFAPLELGLATMLDATTMQIDAVHETFSGGVFDNTSPAALSIPVGALVHTPATKQSLNALYAGISHDHTGVYEPADATILKDADIGVAVQAYSANLAEYAAVNPSAAGLAILDDADAAAQRVTLGLEPGVDVQAYDADIPTVAAPQAEMEAGTEAALRSMSPLRVAQAIAALTISGIRNIIINPGFTINQRGYVSGAVLASGSYGHDRWKAGASGGDYSFTQLASNTQITIAAGKSLIQVVEDKNVHSTRYVLSWEGTAQARTGVNSATPSGSYAASPIVITGQTAGTTLSVEFNEGTLGKVQLKAESSLSVGTPFEPRPYGVELSLCQRYYESKKFGSYFGAAGTWAYTTTWIPKRSAPTISLTGGTQANVTGGGWNETDIYGSRYSVTLSGAGGHWNATLTLDSEL